MEIHHATRPEVFIGKGIPEVCNKFTGDHSCRSEISIKLLFIRTPLDGCF